MAARRRKLSKFSLGLWTAPFGPDDFGDARSRSKAAAAEFLARCFGIGLALLPSAGSIPQQSTETVWGVEQALWHAMHSPVVWRIVLLYLPVGAAEMLEVFVSARSTTFAASVTHILTGVVMALFR